VANLAANVYERGLACAVFAVSCKGLTGVAAAFANASSSQQRKKREGVFLRASFFVYPIIYCGVIVQAGTLCTLTQQQD
jgi:hypothetical protein